jgi:hypothetical protein
MHLGLGGRASFRISPSSCRQSTLDYCSAAVEICGHEIDECSHTAGCMEVSRAVR